jgi:hypothetical protein
MIELVEAADESEWEPGAGKEFVQWRARCANAVKHETLAMSPSQRISPP